MNNQTYILILLGIVILSTFLQPFLSLFDGYFNQEGGSWSSSYFSPWWRNYFNGPYAGTSATTYDVLTNWPYNSLNYYNYLSYWRRPQYHNYWRRPYYFRRPVYRPYVQDSILGRRSRKRVFNFNPIRN